MTLLGWVLLGVYVAGLLPAAVVIAHWNRVEPQPSDDRWFLGCLVWPVWLFLFVGPLALMLGFVELAEWIERKLWKHS